MKLHLFAVAQHARNRWHNITEISIFILDISIIFFLFYLSIDMDYHIP